MKQLEPADPAPISAKQRFKNYVFYTVGPVPILGSAAVGGLQQGRDDPHEWGQDGAGYAQRFGNNMAYNGIRQTTMYGLSEVLHEDNRYFASGQPTVKRRIGYALLSPAICKKRDGHRGVSISALVGIAAAATLSLTWAPSSWQNTGRPFSNFGYTYAGVAGVNVVREFMPDLIRRLRR